jgi:hypothetical protein
MPTKTKKPQSTKRLIKQNPNNEFYYSSSYYSSSTTNSNGNEIKTKIEVHEKQDKKGAPKISGTYDKIVNGKSKEHKTITTKNISDILVSSKK